MRTADAARPWQGAIDRVAAEWGDRLAQPTPGVHIEHKGATLSVHWRTAADPEAPATCCANGSPRQAARRRARGHLGPHGDGGAAARRRSTRAPPSRELLVGGGWRHAVYIGDDHTDADAWRALHAMRDAGALRPRRRSLAVRAPRRRPSCGKPPMPQVTGPAGSARAAVALRDASGRAADLTRRGAIRPESH